MKFLVHLKKHYFPYTVSLLLLLFVTASFFRFYIQHDYLVAYEGDCDPATQSCYIYCEDEECSDPFYYSIIERDASKLNQMCDYDVTTCDQAYSCEGDDTCNVYFCDPEIDGEDACVSNLTNL